ncbi:MAG: hypothetical protein LBS44_02670 [Deltaproteobacteria bacterium]|jgi:DNA-directed RNA polymerase subunit RPC12/RpoP|nr:hypothetical protein [Deltaproteobacteria bacterium]
MNNYSCSNCGAIIQASNYPNSTGCPSGSHNWSDLGQTGNDWYSCSNCGGPSRPGLIRTALAVASPVPTTGVNLAESARTIIAVPIAG